MLNANGKAQADDPPAWAYGERNRKNAHDKRECNRIPFLLSLYVGFELRLVWYDGLP